MFPNTGGSMLPELVAISGDASNRDWFNVHLSMSRYSGVAFGTLEYFTSTPVTDSIRIINGNTSLEFSVSDANMLVHSSGEIVPTIRLGVGIGGSILQQAQSVIISRDPVNRTNVSVGFGWSAYDFYVEKCVARSFFSIIIDDENCIDFRVKILEARDTSDENDDVQHSFCFELIPRLEPWQFMTVPSLLASNLSRMVRHWGANTDGDMMFTECDESILSHLPDIVLSFPSVSEEDSGTILLSPSDYLEINSQLETCRFRFRSVNPVTASPYFDPFRLPFVNVHLANDRISFCDPV